MIFLAYIYFFFVPLHAFLRERVRVYTIYVCVATHNADKQ